MSPLLDLATRCEKARPEDQDALLREAFAAIHGPKPARAWGCSAERDWLERFNSFCAKLEAEAFDSAARVLLGDRVLEWEVHHSNTVRYRGSTAHVWSHRRDHIIGKGIEPGLAISAAALRFHASQPGRIH